MKYTQKISAARENVVSYLPQLANTINSITFRESRPDEKLPAFYMMGPTFYYVRDKVDKMELAHVSHTIASLSYMFDYVTNNPDDEGDRHIRMLALTLYTEKLLSTQPPHAFKRTPDAMDIDFDAIGDMTVPELEDAIRNDPDRFGKGFGDGVREYFRQVEEESQCDEPDSVETEKESNPWLDKQ